jgi:hypothetical protein
LLDNAIDWCAENSEVRLSQGGASGEKAFVDGAEGLGSRQGLLLPANAEHTPAEPAPLRRKADGAADEANTDDRQSIDGHPRRRAGVVDGSPLMGEL